MRSALFNLGVLQAFSHRGLLKYIDYLSSVSGGGYVAGHLAALGTAYREKTQAADSTANWHSSQNLARDLGIDPGTRQKRSDYLFADAGGYLRDVPGSLGQWLIGTLLTFLLFLSGCGAVAALLALYWRSVDTLWFKQRSEEIGFSDFGDELTFAFLPALPVVVVWIAVALGRFMDRAGSRIGRLVFFATTFVAMSLLLVPVFRMAEWGLLSWVAATLASLGIWAPPLIFARVARSVASPLRSIIGLGVCAFFAATVWLTAELVGGPRYSSGTSEITWRLPVLVVSIAFALLIWPIHLYLSRNRREQDRFRQPFRWLTWATVASLVVSVAVALGNGITNFNRSATSNLELNNFATGLAIAAAALQLLTLLGMERVFRSEAQHAPRWQKLAFTCVITSVIALPVFAMLHWMASESISGFAQQREPTLEREDVRAWKEFAVWAHTVGAIDHFDAFHLGEDRLHDCLSKLRGVSDWQRRVMRATTPDGLLKRLGNVYGSGSSYDEYLQCLREQNELRADLIDRVNFALMNGVPEVQADFATLPLQQEMTRRLMHRVFVRAENMSRKQKRDELLSQSSGNWSYRTVQPGPAQPSEYVFAGSNTANLRAAEEWITRRASELTDGARLLAYWRRLTRHNPDETDYESFVEFRAEQLAHLDAVALQPWERSQFNRVLMEALYPDMIRQRTEPSTWIVANTDQRHRAAWLLFWTLLLLLSAWIVDFNRISPLFHFYRDALWRNFLQPARRLFGAPADDVPTPLRKADATSVGLPYNLYSCCLMLRRGGFQFNLPKPGAAGVADGQDRRSARQHLDRAVNDRLSFVMSSGHCGSPDTGYRSTGNYAGGGLTLAHAVTISGSAISPYMTDNAALTLFMSAFNARLGMWLPNPRNGRDEQKLTAPCWTILGEWARGLARCCRDDWQRGFVADGGFRDYLGVEELLVRRCPLIIVTDAGINRAHDEFTALGRLIQTVRVEHGIQVLDLDHELPIDLDRFRRYETRNFAPQQLLAMRIRYPDKPDGVMFYLRMALTGREDIDLQQIRHSYPAFPDEPTTNQFYDHSQVEAYRQLGYHIGHLLCRYLPHRDQLMGPVELTQRLRLAYLEECLAEEVYERDEVSVDELCALRDAAGDSLTLPESEADFDFDENDEAAWIREYEHNPDFRLFHRQRVSRLWCGDADFADCFAIVDDGRTRGRLMVMAIACYEIARPVDGRSTVDEAVDATSDPGQGAHMDEAGRDRVGADVFRVGGQSRFRAAARRFVDRRFEIAEVQNLRRLLYQRRTTGVDRLNRFVLELYAAVYHPRKAADACALFFCCLHANQRLRAGAASIDYTESVELRWRIRRALLANRDLTAAVTVGPNSADPGVPPSPILTPS